MEQLTSAEGMSESETERAQRVHWRKRAAAARRGGRGRARKSVHVASSRPAVSKRKREPPSPGLATHPVLPPQLHLPSPVEEPPIMQPHVASAQPATKLRAHHHEFLSEYSKVCAGAFADFLRAPQAAPLLGTQFAFSMRKFCQL